MFTTEDVTKLCHCEEERRGNRVVMPNAYAFATRLPLRLSADRNDNGTIYWYGTLDSVITT